MRETSNSQSIFESFDRRVNNRFFSELEITACLNKKKINCKVLNMSGNGMQIIFPEKCKINSEQLCHLIIRNEGFNIELDARVVWKRNGLIGLCFTNPEKQVQYQVNELSNRLLMSSIAEKGMSALA